MGLIAQSVQALVGSTYSFSNNEDDTLYENAVATVADTLPNSLMMDYAQKTELDQSPSELDTRGKKILMVTWGGSAGTDKPCMQMDYTGAQLMANANSIYATNHITSELNPIWYIKPTDGTYAYLTTIPAPTDDQSALVYYYTYPTDLTLATDDVIADDNSTALFPPRAYQAVYLKTAELILLTLISDAVVDEEDSELLTLYQNNLAAVQAAYQLEISNLTGGEMSTEAG